ncbi:MAG: sulfotransferase [Thermodesulfovibrionales bacterium]|nr:sulfotransferase [Thermodesulfovibrionales bacterium]
MPGKGEIEVSGGLDLLVRLSGLMPGVWKKLGDMETRMEEGAEGELPRINRPLWVTGLARSGSTILLELLSEHPDTATHKYRDFPFLMTPVWWNSFYDRASGGNVSPEERAHKDRIMVTPESPEAMEEVLWMHFFPSCHNPAFSNVISANESNPAFESFYCDHIRKILKLRGGLRYLSKANYNVTRLSYLLKLFPDARFIVPVREPVMHIASLMKQHGLFLREGRRDRRVTEHLKRSGHYEFGQHRAPVNPGNEEITGRVMDCWADGKEAEGWAEYWAAIYGHVAADIDRSNALKEAVCLVSYETLCSEPRATLERIYSHCGLDASGEFLDRQSARLSPPGYYQPSLSAEEVRLIKEITSPALDSLGF